ncbi:MAG: hypothetical protein IVW55_03990 [Chloroflexi bacterium]|nr:hypothetical protein [Chloroflexota bacterium]
MADSPTQAEAPPPLTEEQVDRWRGYAEEAEKDAGFLARNDELDKQRPPALSEMQGTLQQYVSGRMSSEDLRSVFQVKTMHKWGVFGLKGLAGAMVFNQLVKQIPPEHLDPRLRVVLLSPPPDDETAARARMQEFYNFVEGWRTSHALTKTLIQTTNIPFFISAWWHIQDQEVWPIYYISGRNTLRREGLYLPTGKTVADYFAFRARFRQLQQALAMTPWHFEQLCARLDRGAPADAGETTAPTPKPVTSGSDGKPQVPAAVVTKAEEITHSQVQLMLAKIGQKLGLKVWIAENDRNRAYHGEKLGSLSISQLPNVGMDPETQKTIRLIDVVWIKGQHQIVAAFEVEHTTSVFSGLLRMSDLVAVYPNISFLLYIVAPESRMDLVRRQLRRPTFQGIGLHQRCGYFSDEALFSEYPHIMKWAASPDAIEKQLAQRVGDVQEGEPADWLQD